METTTIHFNCSKRFKDSAIKHLSKYFYNIEYIRGRIYARIDCHDIELEGLVNELHDKITKEWKH